MKAVPVLVCCCLWALVLSPTAALSVSDWSVDVRVFGVAAHSLSVPLPADKQLHDTRPAGNPSPFDEGATPSALMSYYQVAIITVLFDEPLYVHSVNRSTNEAIKPPPLPPLPSHARGGDGDGIATSQQPPIGLERVTDPRVLYGLTRLICDGALIESHPPVQSATTAVSANQPLEFDRATAEYADAEADAAADEHIRFSNHKFRSRPPLFLIPFIAGYSDALPLLSLIETYLRPARDADSDAESDESDSAFARASREYTVALVLGYTHLNGLDEYDTPSAASASDRSREDVRVLTEAELMRCSLQFLKPSSQTTSPPHALYNRAGQPFSGRIAFDRKRSPSAAAAGGDSSARKHETCTFPTIQPQPPKHSARARVMAEVRATIEPTLRLLLEQQVPSLLEVNTHSQVQYKGLVDALVTPVINGVKSVFGGIVSASTAETLVEPVVNHVVSGIGESLVAHLEPFVSGKVIYNIVPATTESIADTITQTVSEALADLMTELMTEPVTEQVTELLSESVIVPVKDRVATEAALKIGHKLTHSLTLTLSRSLSHSIVGSLIHSITQNPLMDYYCYYCSKFQRYCFYCRRSPRQMYYALYYTGYFSQYYSQYYTDVFSKKLGVKIVRRKTIHDFGEEPRVDETFVDGAVYDRPIPNMAHWIY